MKKINFILLLAISLFIFNSCTDEKSNETPNLNFVSFQNSNYAFGVDLGGSTTRNINIYTTNISSSDRTFNIEVFPDLSTADPTSYIVPTQVNVPANTNMGIFSVNIQDLNIGDGKTLVLRFTPTDGLYTGDNITLDIIQICPTNEVFLDINFDNYGSETSWEIRDSANTIIASGGGYADGDSSFSAKFCLDNGNYTFTIFDFWGDGMCCSYGNGSYSLYGATMYASGGSFGVSETTAFTLGN